jgi:hypothetical protein
MPADIFAPCGADDLDDQDTAEFLDTLPGFVEEVNEVKEPVVKEKTFKDYYSNEPEALLALKARLAGDSPWLEASVGAPLLPRLSDIPPSSRLNFNYHPKVFYYPERAYEDWIEMDGVNNLFHWKNESHQPGSDASPYVYSETWQCHCAGKPEIKPKKQDLKKPRPLVLKDSKHAGCMARLYAHKFKDGHPPAEGYSAAGATQRVRITYYGRHTEHILGDKSEFEKLSISTSLRKTIEKYIMMGLGTRAIKDKITLHSDELHRRLQLGTLTRDDFVTSADVSYVVGKYWANLSQLHREVNTSMFMWADKLEKEGCFVFRWNPSVEALSTKDRSKKEPTKGPAVGFSTPWQMEKLRACAGAVGLGSTHKVTASNAELYTVIVQDPHTMRGIPVAFLLTEDKTAEPLQHWLVALEASAGICIRYVTTDDSKVEYKAIKQGLGEDVRIHLCLWHVAREWVTQIRSLAKDDNPVLQTCLQEQARKSMHDIMYEQNLLTAKGMIVRFREFWQEKSKDMLEYFETNYFKENRRVLWMKSYRQDIYYGSMDTNNYVESWHNQLNTNYLKNHHRARKDRILYVLRHVILEVAQKEEFGALIRVGRKSKGQVLDILRQRDVKALSVETLEKHVLLLDNKYLVESMSDPRHYHILTVTDGCIKSCDCEYFLRHHRLCKHILMAFRRFPEK